MKTLLEWIRRVLGIDPPEPLTGIERERYEAMNTEAIEREKGYAARKNSR